MKTIYESYNESRYGYLLGRVSGSDVKDVRNGLDHALTRYKAVRVDAVINANKKATAHNKKFMDKAVADEENKILAYIKTKPGIMRRSPEKQKEYIQRRLDAFKVQAAKDPRLYRMANADFLEDDIKFIFHQDMVTGTNVVFSGSQAQPDNVAQEVAKYINGSTDIKGLYITVDNEDLTRSGIISFNIYPEYTADAQVKLDKRAAAFADFMAKEYSSGKYMGD